jgi:hypothetical protein
MMKRQKNVAAQKQVAQRARVAKRVKPIKEEMNTTGDIRGLGYVSGNPLVDGDFQMQWITLNQSDADTKDQIMNQTKKSFHDDLHSTIDFNRQAAKNLFVNRLVDSIKSRSYK